jgi:hypothetical protein
LARLWSRRIIALKRSRGTSGACDIAISAFVLAGLPTTRTCRSLAAWALSACPCGLKMPPLASSRSARSIPARAGRAPTSRATLTPSNATFGSSLMSMLESSGKAQSVSSIAVPSAAPSAGVISSRRSATGVSGPSIAPLAMRNRMAYPIWPAAPVTATLTGLLLISVQLLDHSVGELGGADGGWVVAVLLEVEGDLLALADHLAIARSSRSPASTSPI